MEMKSHLKSQKSQLKNAMESLSEIKQNLDVVMGQYSVQRSENEQILLKRGIKRADIQDMVDESELRLLKEIKHQKREYKRCYTHYSSLKSSLDEFINQTLNPLKNQILDEFTNYKMSHSSNSNLDIVDFDEENEEEEEDLDDYERFERMEMSNYSHDPSNLAFFQAKKTQRQNQTQVRLL